MRSHVQQSSWLVYPKIASQGTLNSPMTSHMSPRDVARYADLLTHMSVTLAIDAISVLGVKCMCGWRMHQGLARNLWS